jgi:HEAT repeat protein
MLTGDVSIQARSHAAWVIGEMGNKSALPMLRDAATERITRWRPVEVEIYQLQCAEARVKLGDTDPIEGIRAALFPARPEDLEAAILAVQIIGEVKDRGSMDQLIYLSEYKDPRGNPMPADFRLACATALAKMGLDRGSFIADEFARDPNETIRQQAASVYGYTARPEHFWTLQSLMSDPSPIVRVVAASSVIRAHARLYGENLP